MRIVKLTYAKAHLSRLVEEAAGGQPFVIAKAGKPMVKVVPIEAAVKKASSRLGFLKGQFKVPDDFDRMAEDEIAALFEGRKV
ncbi:MAG: type II toxin-antitoxin system prevent-host-death family antitoxin [Bauldia sp.]